MVREINLKSYFLLLPLEVRQMIYSYLVPDTNIPIKEPELPDPRALRLDGTVCSPQLLQVNYQIYEEFFEQFYGHATFAMYVEQHEISFLGTPIYVYDPKFPRALQVVRSLHIEIQLLPSYWTYLEDASPCILGLADHLSQCRGLKFINFAFDTSVMLEGPIPQSRIDWYVLNPQMFIAQHLRRTFAWTMAPFRRLGGVKHFTSITGPVWRSLSDRPTAPSNGQHQSSQEKLMEEADIYCRQSVGEYFEQSSLMQKKFEQFQSLDIVSPNR
jgi:hypothetical protein